jgi:hypothetical protein
MVRLLNMTAAVTDRLPARPAAEMKAILAQPRSWMASSAVLGVWDARTRPQINNTRSLGALPLAVLSVAEQALYAETLTQLQAVLPALSSNSMHRTVQRVIVIGAPTARLQLAREFGADETIDISATTAAERIARVLALTNGRGADVIFECAGVPAAVAEGLEMTCVNGRYVIAGHYSDAGTVPLNPHLINKKQLLITGTWSASNKHFLQGLNLMRKLPIEKLITHRFGLEEANDALITMERQDALKPVIVP